MGVTRKVANSSGGSASRRVAIASARLKRRRVIPNGASACTTPPSPSSHAVIVALPAVTSTTRVVTGAPSSVSDSMRRQRARAVVGRSVSGSNPGNDASSPGANSLEGSRANRSSLPPSRRPT